MKRLARFSPILLLAVLALIAVLISWRPIVVYGQTVSADGLAQINGPIALELTVSPPVGTPGDILQLDVTLTNNSTSTSTPEIIVQLPPGLSLASTFMPAGMTQNLQSRTLNWLPVAAANGGQQQFSLQLRVETADLTQPQRQLTVMMRQGETETSAAAGVWLGVAPQINNIINPPQVAVGQPFQLRAETAGSGPIKQVWHLGDGRRVEVNNPTVVFPAAGLYEVSLEASNPLTSVSQTKSISVVPHPAAQFALDDDSPGVDQPVMFINQSGGAPPLSYLWSFGDGSTATEASPSHVYSSPGTYQVQLIVENEYGRSEAFWNVTIGQPPMAAIELPPSVPAGAPLQGLAFGDESVTQYTWQMGDGHTYNGNDITHVYNATGDYYVSMTASNAFGDTEVGQWVHVDPGTLSLYIPFIIKSDPLAVNDVEPAPADPAALNLPDVALETPFVLRPMPVPPDSTPAEQLFLYINEARRQFDLLPLNYVPALSTASQQHTDDMVVFNYTGHLGADGSTPAERLLAVSYPGGYAGEATAWGFERPHQAVQFWINSPGHRRIILNQAATDVGVGFTVDYNAPNVWYWTAEFGNAFAAPDAPTLRMQNPAAANEVMVTTPVQFSWNWPVPLTGDEQFELILHTSRGAYTVATVDQPSLGTRYTVQLAASEMRSGNSRLQVMPGTYEWQVQLVNGSTPLQSERRTITYLFDPDQPTPTPTVTATPAAPVASTTPTIKPTTTPARPTSTPARPIPTAPPPLVTATPEP